MAASRGILAEHLQPGFPSGPLRTETSIRSLSAGLTRRWLEAGLVLWLLTILAGCGPANAVDVQFKGYSIVPSRASIKAGSITFNLTNKDGQMLHQFVIAQTDLLADKLPLGADAKVDETPLNIVGAVDKVDVGQSGTLTADLAPGHDALICKVPGRYQLGMRTDFTVTP